MHIRIDVDTQKLYIDDKEEVKTESYDYEIFLDGELLKNCVEACNVLNTVRTVSYKPNLYGCVGIGERVSDGVYYTTEEGDVKIKYLGKPVESNTNR